MTSPTPLNAEAKPNANGVNSPNKNAPAPAPAAASVGAKQAQDMLKLDATKGDGFTPTASGFGTTPAPAPATPAEPKAEEAKPVDTSTPAPAVGTPADTKATTPASPEAVKPEAAAPGPAKDPFNLFPKDASKPATGAPTSDINALTQQAMGKGTADKTGKTSTGTTTPKPDVPKTVAQALPNTYTYYSREESRYEEDRSSRSSSSGNSGSGSAKEAESNTKSDTANDDGTKVVATNEEAQKIQGEIGSGAEITKASVVSYSNQLEEQLAQLNNSAPTSRLDGQEKSATKSALTEKLNLAQSLLSRIKGTELRILQNNYDTPDLLPTTGALFPSVFG